MSTGWDAEAGGLDGLGGKPEDMTKLPKAMPARPRPGNGTAPAPSARRQPQQGEGPWLHIWGLWGCDPRPGLGLGAG